MICPLHPSCSSKSPEIGSMKTLLNYFYQLPLEFIARHFLLAALVYLHVLQRYKHCRWLRRGVWATLAVWIAAVLWITLLNRTPGTAYSPELIPFHSYRKLLATGTTEIFRTNFMNIVLFYPAGLLAASLLPENWSRIAKLLSVGIAFSLFSLVIEYVQFSYSLGEPEIDDVIHNMLGSIIGTIPIILSESSS